MSTNMWSLLGKILYWLLLPAIWLYAMVTKPRARVLILHEDQALVVKNWLGAGGWALPGGGLEHDEEPIDAAVREITEELGIDLLPEQLISLGEHKAVESGYLVSKYYLFAVVLSEKPPLITARGEITGADWIRMRQLVDAKKGVGTTVKQSIAVWLNH